MKKELLARLFQHSPDTGNGGGNGQATESQESTEQETGTDTVDNSFKGPQSQSELDSLTNKAVQKALENYKAGEQERIAEAIKKEKDYANLSAADRTAKEFEESKYAFEKEKAAFEHEKLVVQVEKDLVSKSLPVEFAGLLAVGDAEKALAQVGEFETAFNTAVNAKVKESLRQSAPNLGGNGTSQTNYGATLAQGSISTGEKLF